MQQEKDSAIRENLLNLKKDLQRRLLEIPCSDQHDPNFKRLHYCRYADDFVLGAICSKSEAEEIHKKIEIFLSDELKLKISQAKSGLKHNTETIRFLGFDITIIKTEKVVKVRTKDQLYKKRTVKGQITLRIPEAKMKDFAEKKGYGNWETMKARSRPILSQVSDAEIALKYSVEMRGFAQYYAIAVNFSAMNKRDRLRGPVF